MYLKKYLRALCRSLHSFHSISSQIEIETGILIVPKESGAKPPDSVDMINFILLTYFPPQRQSRRTAISSTNLHIVDRVPEYVVRD